MLHITYADGAVETVRNVPVEAVARILREAAAVHPIREAHWPETPP